MPSGAVSNAPSPPIPPALPTAAASPTGQAPAIGAIRIGTRRPKRRQNVAARSRTMLLGVNADIFQPQSLANSGALPARDCFASLAMTSKKEQVVIARSGATKQSPQE